MKPSLEERKECNKIFQRWCMGRSSSRIPLCADFEICDKFKVKEKEEKVKVKEVLADVMAVSPADKAKYFCKLIGCSGLRKECLEGDVNCDILKLFLKGN